MYLFLIRGIAAIVWAALFASASASLTSDVTVSAAVLLVIYPLIDVVASLVDARNQAGPARRLLLENAAVSTVAAVAFAVAATISVAAALAVFGAWALVSGASQFLTALRRRAQLGSQVPLLLAGGLSVIAGIAWFLVALFRDNPSLDALVVYAAGGGIWFVLQAGLLARRRRHLAPTAVA